MVEKLTWEQIQKKYPNQLVGLIDVTYKNNDGITVEAATVKYVNKTKDELIEKVLDGEIIYRYTAPDSIFQLGMVGVK